MKSIYTIILSLGLTLLFGQSMERQVVSAYGAYEESADLALSSTVGEVSTATLEQADIILTQGFQQPNEKEDIDVGIERLAEGLEIKVSPNPTTQKIVLELMAKQNLDLLIHLYDMNGKRLNIGTSNLTIVLGKSIREIDLSNYASGQYILSLVEKQSGNKTSIRIQKVD